MRLLWLLMLIAAANGTVENLIQTRASLVRKLEDIQERLSSKELELAQAGQRLKAFSDYHSALDTKGYNKLNRKYFFARGLKPNTRLYGPQDLANHLVTTLRMKQSKNPKMTYADVYRKVKKYTRPFLVQQGVGSTQAALVSAKKMEEDGIKELNRVMHTIRSESVETRRRLIAVQKQLKHELVKAIKELQESHRSLNETLKKARVSRYTPEAKREIGEAQRSLNEKISKLNRYSALIKEIP